MKESKLIEMQNKVEAIGRVLQQLINEFEMIKTIAMGDHAVIKKLNEYEEIIKQLKEEHGKENTDGASTGTSGSSDSNLELE